MHRLLEWCCRWRSRRLTRVEALRALLALAQPSPAKD
jgi:hypothetical protein